MTPDPAPSRTMTARNVGRAQWGPVETMRPLGNGAYWITTGSHGGLVVVAGRDDDRWPLWTEVSDSMAWPIIARSADRPLALVGEEDCAWSVVALMVPEILPALAELAPDDHDEIEEERTARETAGRWYPDALALIDRLAEPEEARA